MRKLFSIFIAFLCAIGLNAQTPDEWAQVNISVCNVRTTKGQPSELCTQEYMGMPVKILERDGDWLKIETTDGYKGWVYYSCLKKKTAEELDQWKKKPRMVVTSLGEIKVFDSPTATQPRSVVTDLVPCDIVTATDSEITNGRMEIELPDGRRGWADATSFTPISEWASQPFNSEKMLESAHYILGTPYLWGGNSVKGLDCSGLTKLSYLRNGIFLLRDASMQARTGQQLDVNKWQDFQQGDLLFFASKPGGKVTHVALYDKDGWYIHSSGRGERVGINSIDPSNSEYVKRPFVGAVRINGQENTDGIVKAINHPWLF